MAYWYYVRRHTRTLFRAELGSDRVELWSGSGWRPVGLSGLELDLSALELDTSEDVYYRVHTDVAKALTALWSDRKRR